MGNKIDPRCHVGETHGIYTIVDVLDEKDRHGHWIYKCVCNECGYVRYTHYGSVSSKNHVATKCHHLRVNGEFVPYGHKWSHKRLATIFTHMMARCYDTKDKDYRWYGEKGVGVYGPWRNNPKLFEEWAIDNGYNDDLTIDRIDSNKDYCQENCQWISLTENVRKAGKVNWVTVEGVTLTGRQWSEKFGLGVNTINRTLKQYGVEKTTELLAAMLKDPPFNKHRRPNQTWFSVYGIQV